MATNGRRQIVLALPPSVGRERAAAEPNRRGVCQSNLSLQQQAATSRGGLFLFLHDFLPAQFREPVFHGVRGRDVPVRTLVPGVLTTPHL